MVWIDECSHLVAVDPGSSTDRDREDLFLNELKGECAGLAKAHPDKHAAAYTHEENENGLELSAEGHELWRVVGNGN